MPCSSSWEATSAWSWEMLKKGGGGCLDLVSNGTKVTWNGYCGRVWRQFVFVMAEL